MGVGVFLSVPLAVGIQNLSTVSAVDTGFAS